MESKFGIVYILILILDLIVISTPDLHHLRIFSKPLILGSLLVYFIFSDTTKDVVYYLITAALSFSLLGDILLMFEDLSSLYFVFGLLSFLIAHICYSIIFYRQRDIDKKLYVIAPILLILASSLFALINDGLGDLFLAVIVYMIVIIIMVSMAFLRISYQNDKSYLLVLSGAFCFMLSDSLLAIEKFYSSYMASGILIIVTYALAQYLIIMGLKRFKKTEQL